MNTDNFFIHTALRVDIDVELFAGKFTPDHLYDTNFDNTVALHWIKTCGLGIHNKLTVRFMTMNRFG